VEVIEARGTMQVAAFAVHEDVDIVWRIFANGCHGEVRECPPSWVVSLRLFRSSYKLVLI
jgi:GT2 family glycosyltransferase